MTVPIKPIDCLIREGFLYKNESAVLLKSKIIGISAYKGFAPSLQIMVENSYLYSDVPFNEVFGIKMVEPYDYCSKTTNITSPSYKIDVYYFLDMTDKEVTFLDVNSKRYKKGTYILSVDYYTDNEQYHLIKGNDGRFWGIPNHKINWNNIEYLPKYKKK